MRAQTLLPVSSSRYPMKEGRFGYQPWVAKPKPRGAQVNTLVSSQNVLKPHGFTRRFSCAGISNVTTRLCTLDVRLFDRWKFKLKKRNFFFLTEGQRQSTGHAVVRPWHGKLKGKNFFFSGSAVAPRGILAAPTGVNCLGGKLRSLNAAQHRAI